MRQHVNPLSKNFHGIDIIPPCNEIFADPDLPLHLDIGSAAGDFLFDLAVENSKWNYLGIEIRQKLVENAKFRKGESEIKNLYFAFENANNIFIKSEYKFLLQRLNSISFNFPDPWFKKKHHKRRVIQPDLISRLSNLISKESLIFIKTDVKELFEYMNFTILSNLKFRKLENSDFNYYKSFNPTKIKTNREKYVIINNLDIFEGIYTRI